MDQKTPKPAILPDEVPEGMTMLSLRDMYAAHALVGLLSALGKESFRTKPGSIARNAFLMADAMILHRNMPFHEDAAIGTEDLSRE